MARAVLEAADRVRAGTWVDPNPPRRLTDDKVQAWIDDARVRCHHLRTRKAGPDPEGMRAYYDLHGLIIEAEIMLRRGPASKRPSAVESAIIEDMKARE